MQKEGTIRIPAGCAIAAMISRKGRKMDGGMIARSMKTMHERSNGLGGGFAGYGIYPEYRDCYAFHIFFNGRTERKDTEVFLKEKFDIVKSELLRTRKTKKITDEPVIWRYFLLPLRSKLAESQKSEDDFVAEAVTRINTFHHGAYVFSSGKDMGVFKAVGYPEDVGEFYRLDEYEAYSWTAHGRYPTNTPGWWAGSHPFSLLDFSVVHNGEISSYDANRRFVEMFGYRCNLKTDTEVMTYMMDYLIRREGLTVREAACVIAAPFWSTIEKKEKREAEVLTYLRMRFPSLLVTGPFSIIFAFTGGLMALNDRLKLRGLVAGSNDDMVYIASEEAALFAMDNAVSDIVHPRGGEPFIVEVEEKAI